MAGAQIFNRLSGFFLIPIAKIIYAVIAIVCLLAIVGGLIFIIYLQASTAVRPETVPVPPPYHEPTPNASLPSNQKIDINIVKNKITPPSKIKFINTIGLINAQLRPNIIIGYFVAETANEIAPYPDGLSIIGGHDAEKFERAFDQRSQKIGLAPTVALLNELNSSINSIKQEQTKKFSIRVVMRDRFGMVSVPADVTVEIIIAPPPALNTNQPVETKSEQAELQKLAIDIAKHLEPVVNPAYFDAYKKAEKLPGKCGVANDNLEFIFNYRKAFDETKTQLLTSNIDAFYEGVCMAWKEKINREIAEQELKENERRAAMNKAEEDRRVVEQYNENIRRDHALKVMAANGISIVTLIVVGSALATFLGIAILLAFLAIENHSRAMRMAITSMVKIND